MSFMKRTLALLLAVVLTLGLLPGQVPSVYAQTAESIFVSYFPEEQRYLVYGQELNTDGLELTLYYEDGSTELVTEGYSVYGYDPYQWGMQMLTVEYEGMVAENLEVYVYLEGSCGDDVTYTFGPAGDLNIGGTGSMVDYADPADAPWYPYRDQITMIYVNEGVESIGANAFYGACNTFGGSMDVMIPLTVTQIGDNAFYGAEGMYVNYSGSRADWSQIFVGSGNEALEQADIYYGIVMPESISVSKLPDKTEYAAGEELDTTGMELTVYYDDGTEYTVTDGFEVWGFDSNMSGCQSVTVSYEGLETWFDVTVAEPTAESLYVKNLPKTEYFLGQELDTTDLFLGVVYNNGYTEEVSWDYEVTGFDSAVLGEQTLTVSYAGLTATYTVTVKDPAVTVVGSGTCGENATWELYANGRLIISGTGPMDNYFYISDDNCKTAPWKAYCDGSENAVFITKVEISEGITSVGDRTFDSNGELSEVTIADSVTYIGHGAFANNHSLETVVIPAGVTVIGDSAFDSCSLLSDVQIGESVTEIGYSAFGFCTNLTEVTLPDSVTTIGEWAFNNCTALTSITIPNGVTVIETYTFDECSSLTSVTIPAGVTAIDRGAFSCCSALTDVHYGGTAEQWTQISIAESNDALTNAAIHYAEELEIIASGTCGDSLTWTLDEEGTLTISGTGAMTDYGTRTETPWYDYVFSIDSLVLESGVTSVGTYAFAYCVSLTSVTIPGNVLSIGDSAFSNCTNLTSVEICDGVELIDDYAFYYTRLSSVTVPGSVKSIGRCAFALSALESVTLCEGVETIGIRTFEHCSGITEISIPSTVCQIGERAFFGNSVTSLVIPEGVTSLESYVFGSCTKLTDLYIPESVTYVADYAAYNCTALESVTFGGSKAQWNQISFGYGNAALTDAALYCMVPPAVVGIAIATPPNKTEYFVGQSLEADGLTLEVYYDDGSTQIVTPNLWWYEDIYHVPGEYAVSVQYENFETSFMITVRQPNPVKIMIDTEYGYRNQYYFGDALDLSGLVLRVEYEDGITQTVTDGYEVTGYDPYVIGMQTLTVSYEGLTTLMYVTVEPITVEYLEIETLPGKLSYFYGEPLDTTGLTLRAYYNNGEICTVTEGFTVDGFDPCMMGMQNLSVYYETAWTGYTVTVDPIMATYIYVDTMPNRTMYFVGDQLDTTGMSLTVNYNNGNIVSITEGFEVMGYDPYMSGEQCVTISYEGQSTYFYINVQPIVATYIYVDTMPNRMMYFVGDQLDTTGMSLTVNYNNGNIVSITEGFEVMGYDPYMSGEQCVTISYEGQSTYFYINVQPIMATYIYVDQMPDRTGYFVGDQLDTTGMSLMVTYNNGNVVSVTEGYEVMGYDPYMSGEQCVTVSYEGQTTYFNVMVSPIIVTHIGIDSMPNKTFYYVGEELDTTGMMLTVHYNNGDMVSVAEGYEVMGYDPYVTGEQCVTVTYEDQSTYFYIIVEPVVAAYIGIETMPNKTVYYTGEELDTTGLMLAVTYNNGITEYISEGYAVTGYDPNIIGEQCVTVTYEDQSAFFYVNVEPIVVTGIDIQSVPNKTAYLVGDELDATGLELMVYYNNGTTTTVTEGYEVTGFDSTTPGTQILTVTYEGFTATFEVTVEEPVKLEIISQPASVEITAGFVAQFTVEATDVATYKWQYRRNENAPWVNTTLPGYTTATLSVPAILSRNGYQYRCHITSNNKTVLSTEPATLTVNDSIFISSQPTRQIVCVDTNASFSVVADGAGLTYQWHYRKNDEDFWKVTGMTGNKTATLTVPAIISRNGYQYRCVITDENGIKIYSKVAVLSTIGFTVQPADQKVPVNTDAVFSVEAKGQSLTYKWQYRKSSTGSWLSTSLPGYDTNTLTVLAATSRNGYQYRCGITDALGTLVYSDPATLTVGSGIEITSQPTDQMTPVTLDATFAVEATGDGLTYQWQYRKSSTGSWLNTSLPGYNTDTLIVSALEDRHGYQYRCVITDSVGVTAITDVATLSVRTTLLIHTQPANQTALVDTDAVFSLFATGIGVTYQWQYRAPGGSWYSTSLPGYNTNTLTVAAIAGRNNYQYRCQLTDANGNTMQSHTAVLTVEIPKADAAITAQPTNQTVYIGENAVFSVTASGTDLTYQWQYQKVGTSSNWLNTSLTGAKTDTLTVGALAARNGYRYRCVITDTEGNTLISDSVTLTVNNPSAEAQITSQPTDQTVAVGDSAQFSVAVTGSDLTYQWQYCSGADSGWISTSMTGAKTNTLTVAAIAGRNGYQYRCVITDANGCVINSEIVTLTVE